MENRIFRWENSTNQNDSNSIVQSILLWFNDKFNQSVWKWLSTAVATAAEVSESVQMKTLLLLPANAAVCARLWRNICTRIVSICICELETLVEENGVRRWFADAKEILCSSAMLATGEYLRTWHTHTHTMPEKIIIIPHCHHFSSPMYAWTHMKANVLFGTFGGAEEQGNTLFDCSSRRRHAQRKGSTAHMKARNVWRVGVAVTTTGGAPNDKIMCTQRY